MKVQFADWNGDGMVDMVASANTRLQYFSQGICFAKSACNQFAGCNTKTGRCESGLSGLKSESATCYIQSPKIRSSIFSLCATAWCGAFLFF